MACATAKKDGSSRYANSIRARSTRLAGSVRERAIAPNSAKSVSPIANSIACRHALMSSTLSANQSRKPRTHVGKCESSTYDGFHGIDVLVHPSGIEGLIFGSWATLSGERLSCVGPAEGPGHGGVEISDELLDPGLQHLLAGEVAAADKLSYQNGKPDFDLIEP